MDAPLTINAREAMHNLSNILHGNFFEGLHEFLAHEPIAESEEDEAILSILQKAYMDMSIHYADCENDNIMRDILVAQHDLNSLGYAI